MTDWTSVRLSQEAKAALDNHKCYDEESYESVVQRLLEQAEADAGAAMTAEDVEQACASAIRDELGEVLQR